MTVKHKSKSPLISSGKVVPAAKPAVKKENLPFAVVLEEPEAPVEVEPLPPLAKPKVTKAEPYNPDVWLSPQERLRKSSKTS